MTSKKLRPLNIVFLAYPLLFPVDDENESRMVLLVRKCEEERKIRRGREEKKKRERAKRKRKTRKRKRVR